MNAYVEMKSRLPAVGANRAKCWHPLVGALLSFPTPVPPCRHLRRKRWRCHDYNHGNHVCLPSSSRESVLSAQALPAVNTTE